MCIRTPMVGRLSVTVLAACVSTALAGPEWTEMGDAGSLPPGAQTPTGMGPLGGISGSLTGTGVRGAGDADFEDVYRIFIDDPLNFTAFIAPNSDGDPTFDTQLFLFDRQGDGVIANDDNPMAGMNGESGFGNQANDGTGALVQFPGVYFIAISGAGNAPRTLANQRIFSFDIPEEVSGPDGNAVSRRLFQWTGPGDTGVYNIQFTGVSYLPPPKAADFNNDGCVDAKDLAILLAGWGQANLRTDINGDGVTDAADLAILLAAWGGCDATGDA